MSTLKSLFNSLKKEGYIIKKLDQFLLKECGVDPDRAFNVNAPSQIGKCLRGRYYSRVGAECDSLSEDPRSTRIFNNGTHVHLRLQEYLLKEGMLLLDEVPVISKEYNIQGHTDGILALSAKERGILEIKSINLKNFTELKVPKPDHIMQGLSYIYCIEERRKELLKTYTTEEAFIKGKEKRRKYNATFYTHLKGGSKHTAKEKLDFQLELHESLDTILWHTPFPVNKAVFLYECKDNQELKEFTVCTDDNKELLTSLLKECQTLNDCVKNKKVPDRCATTKSDNACRWCNYKTECWN